MPKLCKSDGKLRYASFGLHLTFAIGAAENSQAGEMNLRKFMQCHCCLLIAFTEYNYYAYSFYFIFFKRSRLIHINEKWKVEDRKMGNKSHRRHGNASYI